MTSTYRFQIGFYGSTDIPAEFQKAMNYSLMCLKNTCCFLDDIIIVIKRSEEEHTQYNPICLKRLDEKNLWINLSKSHFSNLEIDWLGYHISPFDILPLEQNFSYLDSRSSKTLTKLRYLLGSVHYIIKFTPNLSQISHPFRAFF